MKLKKYNIIAVAFATLMGFSSCNDFLDRKPISDVTPESYFSNADQLLTYTITMYPRYFNTHSMAYNAGTFLADNGSDNQAGTSANNKWAPGRWRVPDNGGGWDFNKIRDVNYFLQEVLAKKDAGKIQGSEVDINQAIGEAYFFRAMEYFNKLTIFGDFPIVKEVLPDENAVLVKASERRPQNEVARFIIEDLDKAIDLLKPNPVNNKNRLSKQAALLLKSRVALYEGTWLKYHKGTAMVPGGPGWPGANKDFLKDFSIDIDSEISYFLNQAMDASKKVADAMPLTPSNHKVQGAEFFQNPYYNMFSAVSMSDFSEVILWRAYDADNIGHRIITYLSLGGAATGYTKDFMDSFLMKNGLPIYANNSGYHGDDYIKDLKEDRDERLQLFMLGPDEVVATTPQEVISGVPPIFEIPEQKSVTGYGIKKGLSPNSGLTITHTLSNTGCLVFRATEAYLNYIEAEYVLNGSLDGTATQYWRELRERAGLPADFNVTISNTDLSREEDLAKYSHGQLVDATLYNIRRERRCELIAEGMRMDDLRRWRALDQLKDHPYILKGFKIWGPMKEWYKKDDGTSALVQEPNDGANVSSESLGMYLRPYQVIKGNNPFYEGFKWVQAEYFSPIPSKTLQLTSKDGDPSTATAYQNPGWPTTADGQPDMN